MKKILKYIFKEDELFGYVYIDKYFFMSSIVKVNTTLKG